MFGPTPPCPNARLNVRPTRSFISNCVLAQRSFWLAWDEVDPRAGTANSRQVLARVARGILPFTDYGLPSLVVTVQSSQILLEPTAAACGSFSFNALTSDGLDVSGNSED